MQTWAIPFLFCAFVLGLYLFTPDAKRAEVQKGIRKEINFYLIAALILIIPANAGTLIRGHAWLKIGSWVLLVVACAVCAQKALAPFFAAPPDDDDEAEDERR